MAARRRIRTRRPESVTINPTIEVPGDGLVQWGPRFGKNTDSTYEVDIAVDLATVDLTGAIAADIAVDLATVDLTGNTATTAAVDLQFVDLDGAVAVGSTLTMPTVDLAGAFASTAAVDLAAVDLAADTAVTAAVTGTAVGAPFWQSVSTFESGAGAQDIVLTVPAGVVDGDLLVMVGTATGTLPPSITAPAGWTREISQTRAGTSNLLIVADWRIASSEPADYTWTVGSPCTGTLHHVIGQDATPIDASASDSANELNPTAAAVTTTTANCLVIQGFLQLDALNPSYTPPTGHDERSDLNAENNVGTHIHDSGTGTRVFAATGTAGPFTWTKSGGTPTVGVDTVTVSVAIAPGTVVL